MGRWGDGEMRRWGDGEQWLSFRRSATASLLPFLYYKSYTNQAIWHRQF
ncbi:MAG: hypothetical protein F6J90_39520 [Moorea sp. SIOASIH]|nr:hypothetical protein [Moorena sp. SIOASIH]NEO42087.1 hypothetical protein [Moorena sp. SIOASIH]NEO90889.1 hypothetical protein [Moorena sp. SIO3G5]